MAETRATSDNLTVKIAAGIPDRGVGLAYGPTQTLNGVDLVPVAFVSYGFGAVQGSNEIGDGGGGGGVAIPIGAYVGGQGGLRFEPNAIALFAVAIPVITALGFAIARIVKAAS